MSKFSFFFLATPPITLELHVHIRGGLLIANHLDRSLWLTNQKYSVAVRSNLLHSFLEVCSYVAPFTSHTSCTNLVQKNQFPELNRHILTFSQINFMVWSHILRTIGDALMAHISFLRTWKTGVLGHVRVPYPTLLFFPAFIMAKPL
jgi:hypothetical protein